MLLICHSKQLLIVCQLLRQPTADSRQALNAVLYVAVVCLSVCLHSGSRRCATVCFTMTHSNCGFENGGQDYQKTITIFKNAQLQILDVC